MKKSKRQRVDKAAGAVERSKPRRAWWPWAAALAGLLVVLGVYGPALSGAFVLDDRYLPFMDPNAAQTTLRGWVVGLRPLLYFSYWLNFQSSGIEPYGYHLTNVFLHFLASVVITLVAARLLGEGLHVAPEHVGHSQHGSAQPMGTGCPLPSSMAT